MADFGFARLCGDEHRFTQRCGTLCCAAPEVFEADVGQPYIGDPEQFSVVYQEPANIGLATQDLLRGMLRIDPAERWTTQRILVALDELCQDIRMREVVV